MGDQIACQLPEEGVDVAGGAGSTLVSRFVSASEGDEIDRGFSFVSSSTSEGEGSFERTGEADMGVTKKGGLGNRRCLVRSSETTQEQARPP